MQKCTLCGKPAYVFKDSVCYDCLDEVDKKLVDNQYKALKAQFSGNSGNNTENSSGKSLEDQLEEEKTLREDYESKLRIIAEQTFEKKKKELNAPDWIQSPKALTEWLESQEGKSGKGTVSLRPEDIRKEHNSSGELEFSSHVELIDYLRSESLKGDAEAKANLEKLWEKVVTGMREQPQKTLGWQYQDKEWLKKFKEAQTREWKKKKGVKEDE